MSEALRRLPFLAGTRRRVRMKVSTLNISLIAFFFEKNKLAINSLLHFVCACTKNVYNVLEIIVIVTII